MRPFEKIGVVGAGMMGSEIALMFALAGHPTILSDQEPAQANKALERLRGSSNAEPPEASGAPNWPSWRDTISAP